MYHHKEMQKEGIALITILIFTTALVIVAGGILSLINAESNMARYQLNSTKAFFLAEAGMERAIAELRDTGALPTGGGPDLEFQVSETGLSDCAELDNINIRIQCRSTTPGTYEVTSNAEVGEAERSVQAVLMLNPPWSGFNYARFNHRYAHYYPGIYRGDIRTNDVALLLSGPPYFGPDPLCIEGELYVTGPWTGEGMYGPYYNITGKAATVVDGEYIYQHPNCDRLEMPVLYDLSPQRQQAISRGTSITIGGTPIIDRVYGDEGGETGNVYLEGTDENPITINGLVVVEGNVIIKGKVTGQGTIYAGRNIYIVGDLEYVNPPSTPRPDSDDPAVVEAWVDAANNPADPKDILVLAAYENIVIGSYHDFQLPQINQPMYIGSEDVGLDGFGSTIYGEGYPGADEGENNGVFDPGEEDLDGDGIVDDNYTIDDTQVEQGIVSEEVPGYPVIGDVFTSYHNFPENYFDPYVNDPYYEESFRFRYVAAEPIEKIEAVCFSNHLIIGEVWENVSVDGGHAVINGSFTSTDGMQIYGGRIELNYDERIHSRNYSVYPTFFNTVGLPRSNPGENTVAVLSWWEGEESGCEEEE